MSKILHLIGRFDSDEGGAQRVIVDIVNNCRNRDLQMGICALFGKATLFKELPEDVFRVNLNYSNKYSPGIFWSLYKVISEWQPNILHVHTPIVGIFGRPIAKLCGVKLISTVHTDVRKISRRNKILDKATIGLSDAVICVSDLVKDSLIEEYYTYMRRNDVYTIPNAIDCSRFRDQINMERAEKRKELNLSNNCFIVGTVGRLHPHKGHKYLIKAWSEVIDEIPDAVLLLIGDGKEKKVLKELVENLNISNSLYLMGSRDDVPELLNMIDLFVFPSVSEGFGLALLEAMCMEKVIVTSDINPLNQIVGDTALLVPPGDSKILAKQIIKVLNNFKQMQSLGERAADRIKEKFNPKEFGERYLDVYSNYI